MLSLGIITSMATVSSYRAGFIGGFVFGTLGVFVLAVLSLVSPFFETLFSPLLWPGKWIASVLTPVSASPLQLVVLYAFTGFFYAFTGLLIQIVVRAIKHSPQNHQPDVTDA